MGYKTGMSDAESVENCSGKNMVQEGLTQTFLFFEKNIKWWILDTEKQNLDFFFDELPK